MPNHLHTSAGSFSIVDNPTRAVTVDTLYRTNVRSPLRHAQKSPPAKPEFSAPCRHFHPFLSKSHFLAEFFLTLARLAAIGRA